jgi:opacity protein-like surface antigen
MERRGNLLVVSRRPILRIVIRSLSQRKAAVPRIAPRVAAVVVVVTLAASAVGSAAAQKKVALFALGGYYIASDLYAGTTVNGKVTLDDSPTYGGRLVFMSNPRVGVELSYARARSDIHGGTIAEPLEGNINLDQLDISGLYAGYNGAGRGYVSLGLGTTGFTPHPTGRDGSTQWRFAWNVGAGFMFDVGKSLIGRIDGRYRGVNTNRQTGSSSYCDAFGNCYGYASMVYSSGEVTAGLGIKLGR